MGAVKVRFEHKSNTARVLRSMRRNTDALVDRTLDVMHAGAQFRCPVQTGYLKSTITKFHPPGTNEGEVHVGASYGLYVHQGTRHMRGQPFLLTAAKDAHKAVLKPGMKRIFRY